MKKKVSRRSLKNPKCNPNRYKRYKYLGKRVADVGGCGLDSASEYLGILREIMKDYRSGRISCETARGRLLLLYHLTYPQHNSKARKIPAKVRQELRKKIKVAMEKVRCK